MSDNDWPAVRQNFSKAHQVWIRLGKLLRREGVDSLVSAMFYWAVVQAVLLFGEEAWVLMAAMYKNLEGVHVGCLRQVTVKTSKWQRDRNWRNAAAESVLKISGNTDTGDVH